MEQGGVQEIDYDRWYRELFRKFTTLRDACETRNMCYDEVKLVEKLLQIINFVKPPNFDTFNRVSIVLNKTFVDVMK